MSIARLRALTRQEFPGLPQEVSTGRNEYRPIKGIDTEQQLLFRVFPFFVEMRIARLRALTQFLTEFL